MALVHLDMEKEKIAALAALEANHGIITNACGSIGLARSTFYHWASNDPTFKAAVDEITETAIDFVESKLFEKINGVSVTRGTNDIGEPIVYDVPPSDTAIIFFLKTKAKKRGYIEKSEVGFTDSDGKDVKPQLIFQPAPNCTPIDSSNTITE